MENLDIILKVIIAYSFLLTSVVIYKGNSSYFTGPDTIDCVVAGPVAWVCVLLAFIIRNCKFIREPFFKVFDYFEGKKKSKTYNIKEAERIVKLVVWLAKRDKFLSEQWYDLSKSYVYVGDHYGWEGLMIKSALWERLNKHFSRLMYKQHHLGMEFLINYLEPIQQSDLVACDEYWAERYNLGEYGTIYKFK